MSHEVAVKLLAAVAESKNRGLARVLNGIAIRHVGQRVAFLLAKKFRSIEALRAATVEEIAKAISNSRKKEEVSEKKKKGKESRIIAESVHDYFQTGAAKTTDGLAEVGVSLRAIEPARKAGALQGKTFVVTGTLKNYTRDEIQEAITRHGGTASSSLSKNTDYLIAGEKAGSKYDKAKTLGVPVITEEDFEKLIQG